MSSEQPLPGPRARELPTEAPFWTPRVTLALLLDGVLVAGHTKGDKRAMLEVAHRAQFVFATWTGDYRSDIFAVSLDRCRTEQASGDKSGS